MPDHRDDADLVLAARDGDTDAFSELFRRWSDRCYDVARRILHSEGAAADIAQDTFLATWRQLATLRDPSAFGGWVLRTARNKALNQLERERRSVATADTAPALAELQSMDDVEATVTSGEQQDLVWAAAAVLGERDTSVLDLHLRHGLSAAELADELGVTTNNAHQLLHRMKQRLGRGVRAWVLFRGGDPSCEALALALADAGVTTFGRAAARAIDRHLENCATCETRHAAVLAPEALFGAVPMIAMGAGRRDAVAAALRADGVPLTAAATNGPATTEPSSPLTESAAPAAGPGVEARSAPTHQRRRAVLAAAAVVALAIGGLLAVRLLSTGDNTDQATEVGPTGAEPAPALPTTAPPSTAATTTSLAVTTIQPTGTLAVDPPAGPGTEAPPATPTPIADPPAPVIVPQPPTPPRPLDPVPPAPVPPAAPTVQSFTVANPTAPDAPCSIGSWAFTLTWQTSDATTVAIGTGAGNPTSGLPPDGTTVICRATPSPPPSGWTLTATGPGGTATASA